MKPEIRRTDEGDSSDLIEQGKLHLQVLAREAQAARAEARRAELELAIASAQTGDPSILEQWFKQQQGTAAVPQPVTFIAETSGAVRSELTVDSSAAAPAATPSSKLTWQTLAPHAQSRLQQTRLQETREQLLPRSMPKPIDIEQAGSNQVATAPTQPSPSLSNKDATSADALPIRAQATATLQEPQGPVEQTSTTSNASTAGMELLKSSHAPDKTSLARKQESEKKEAKQEASANSESTGVSFKQETNKATATKGTTKKTAVKTEKTRKERANRETGKKESPKQELVKISKTFGEEQNAALASKQRKMLVLSGVSGLGASLIAHVAVVILLMIITLKMPESIASLSFESSATEAIETPVEITQPTEVTATEVSPEMPTEVVSDVSESLAAVSSLSADSLSESLPTPTSSLSSLAAASAASTATGKPNPAGANASFFGASASGNSFCYVIDGSESMRGGPWEAAKAELQRSLGTLKEKQRFYIIFFNKELYAIPMPGEREPAKQLLYATPENIKHARNWLESLRISPGAPPLDALKLAIEREPEAIYLLTDGETKVDLAGFLRKENRTSDFVSGEQVNVPIHAIAYYSLLGETLMRQVAAENKGQFIYVPKPGKR